MKQFLTIPLIVILLFASCTKKTTINDMTSCNNQQPAFTVDGITNVTLTNGGTSMALPLSVQYNDSAQEMVTLSLSALPAGITINSGWVTSGYPSFSSPLTFYDTSSAGAAPGTYNMVLTATGTVTGSKSFPFNLVVNGQSNCDTTVTGSFSKCSSCTSTEAYYSDSIYADPTVNNKIWFTNFDNTGSLVYGTLNCYKDSITIPLQTVGSYTFSGSGNFLSQYIYINYLLVNGDSCYVIVETAKKDPICLANKNTQK